MQGCTDWISARKRKLEETLQALLSAKPVSFLDISLKSGQLKKQGIYAISCKSALPGEYLHVGRSKSAGLRGRILSQHLGGGGKGAESDLIQKVQTNKLATNREEASRWIKENCQVQWIIEEDGIRRAWAEHYILSVLQPKWGH
jgi:hypothetical protein